MLVEVNCYIALDLKFTNVVLDLSMRLGKFACLYCRIMTISILFSELLEVWITGLRNIKMDVQPLKCYSIPSELIKDYFRRNINYSLDSLSELQLMIE